MRRTRADDPEFSQINITPLTDVVLVLLLIFMVATPALVSRSLPVTVPDAGTAEEAPPPAVTVSIAADRRVYVEEREVNPDSLQQAILPMVGDSLTSGASVVVRADTAATHGLVVRVLDALRKSGVRPVLGVEAPEQ
jgi:biopolymer transport protein ExbD